MLLANALAIQEAIVDEFANKTLDKNLKIKKERNFQIVDDFANKTLDKNLKIKKAEKINITDDFANRTLDKNLTIIKPNYSSIMENNLNAFLQGNIKVSPIEYYTTRKNLIEGQYIDFILVQDVEINKKIYKKGSKIKARVETVTKNGAYGTPADIVIDNFTLEDKTQLNGQINKRGADRSIWVYPSAYLLSFFFGLGLFILPIRGGHAKLLPNKIYEIDI